MREESEKYGSDILEVWEKSLGGHSLETATADKRARYQLMIH